MASNSTPDLDELERLVKAANTAAEERDADIGSAEKLRSYYSARADARDAVWFHAESLLSAAREAGWLADDGERLTSKKLLALGFIPGDCDDMEYVIYQPDHDTEEEGLRLIVSVEFQTAYLRKFDDEDDTTALIALPCDIETVGQLRKLLTGLNITLKEPTLSERVREGSKG